MFIIHHFVQNTRYPRSSNSQVKFHCLPPHSSVNLVVLFLARQCPRMGHRYPSPPKPAFPSPKLCHTGNAGHGVTESLFHASTASPPGLWGIVLLVSYCHRHRLVFQNTSLRRYYRHPLPPIYHTREFVFHIKMSNPLATTLGQPSCTRGNSNGNDNFGVLSVSVSFVEVGCTSVEHLEISLIYLEITFDLSFYVVIKIP